MSKQENIQVSILCPAYNHSIYIRDAIDSFLSQKTNFDYEIVINDDCSTDDTRTIIEEYAQKYPDIIVPIYQKENQYSKGTGIIKDILIPKARGKYIAICEGDDYWIDENKLQLQYDYLESHDECSFCVHNARLVDEHKHVIGNVITSKHDGIISTSDVIINGGDYIATSSLFARKPSTIPSYFDVISLDYTWQIFFASLGDYTYCFKKAMSVYRIGSIGSWSSLKSRNFEVYKKREIDLFFTKQKLRKEFNIYNNNRFADAIEMADNHDRLQCAVCIEDYQQLKKEPIKSYIKTLTPKLRLKCFALANVPPVYNAYKKLKSNIRKLST
jgi:glycosyltransferase involved in cell wall biosynthesis